MTWALLGRHFRLIGDTWSTRVMVRWGRDGRSNGTAHVHKSTKLVQMESHIRLPSDDADDGVESVCAFERHNARFRHEYYQRKILPKRTTCFGCVCSKSCRSPVMRMVISSLLLQTMKDSVRLKSSQDNRRAAKIIDYVIRWCDSCTRKESWI